MTDKWHVSSIVVQRTIHAGDVITYDTRTRQFRIRRQSWLVRQLAKLGLAPAKS